MASTRRTLEDISAHLEESMGVRQESGHNLVPRQQAKDVSRRPLRNMGTISVSEVMPDPDQPRREFSEEALDRLAQSLCDQGQLIPIRVRWSAEHGKWIIVSGERRWRAAQRAGLATIACSFHEDPLPLTPAVIVQQQLIENCLREDLTPLEEAQAFARLIELCGCTAKELADRLRLPPSRISRALALLRLPGEVQAQVASGKIAPRTAYELSKVDEDTRQQLASGHARLTHAEARRAVQRRAVQRRRSKAKPRRGTRQVFVVEDGWKVEVSASQKASYDDIERALLQALDEVRHRIKNNVQLF
jgi:ParB family chromosome partitioning protein